jgi:hypothetical protein
MEIYEESCVVCGDGPYVASLLLLVARYCEYNVRARLLSLFPSQLWLNVTLGYVSAHPRPGRRNGCGLLQAFSAREMTMVK